MSELFLEKEKVKNTRSAQNTKIDQEDLRRLVLGKVYRLLIRLADETQDQKEPQEVVEEESVEKTPVQLELL